MELSSLPYPFVPMWLLAILFFAGLLAAREVGKYARSRQSAAGRAPGEDSFALNSVLGLLALLIGFTFSIALSRYETRRELVVQEANAIGTTWLRMDLLEGADRARMQALLRRYLDARIAFGQARTSLDEKREFKRTEAVQAELWAAMVQVTAPFRDTARASLLISTTNESIDLAAERYASRQSHIPPRILRLLLIFSLLTAGLVGYERGGQRREATLLFVLLTLAVTLVIDLDRPTTGLTNVSQQPMLDLRASMGEAAPAAATTP